MKIKRKAEPARGAAGWEMLSEWQDCLIHGDNMDLLPCIPDAVVDLIVTDPPYGMGYRTDHKKDLRRKHTAFIHGDKELPLAWIPDAYRVLKDGSAAYVFCHWRFQHLLSFAMTAAGFKIKNLLIMNKTNWTAGDLSGDYSAKYECCLYATKGRHILTGEKRPTNVLDVSAPSRSRDRFHPTPKPPDWIVPLIYNSSLPHDLVLDPFAGSGIVGAVCESMDRRYILMELESDYCEKAAAMYALTWRNP